MAQPLWRGDRHETLPIRAVGLVVAILLIGLSGCASQAAGTADDATMPTSASSEQAAGDAPTGGAGSATKTLQACDLLTPDDLAELEVSGPPRSSHSGSCSWSGETYEVSVKHVSDLTMDTIRSSQDITPLSLGSRDAVQYTSGGDSCLVAIGLADSTIVFAIGVAPGNVEKSCELASKSAEAVEPNLP